MKIARISVPGKIHLIGEHTSVFGRPAILAAVDKRCYVSIDSSKNREVQIISKNYNLDLSIDIDHLTEKLEQARKSWNIFIDTKDISFLSSISKDPLDYLFLIVGETLKYYDASLKSGFSLELDSHIPIGAGSGSSSALAVGIVSAISLFLGKPLDKEIIFQIAVKAEELKHGTPSGGDIATVLYGGFVWFQKISTTEKIIKPIAIQMSDNISSHFYVVNTGKPVESTGEMIAIVREFKEKYPAITNKIFEKQEKLTEQLLEVLKRGDDGLIKKIIKDAEQNLEKLGVVSEYVKKVIREIEASGGAAKISGAGGKTKASGMLLVFHDNRDTLISIVKRNNIQVQQVALGGKGLQREK